MKYPGKLGRRRPYKEIPNDEAGRNVWRETEIAERREVARELFEFHGITHGDWTRLGWALADYHVPEMERGGRPGHPKQWDDVNRAELLVDVEDTIARSPGKEMSVASALANVAKREPWASKVAGSKDAVGLLRAQHKQADPMWAKIVRQSRAWNIYEADPEENFEAATRAAGLPWPESSPGTD